MIEPKETTAAVVAGLSPVKLAVENMITMVPKVTAGKLLDNLSEYLFETLLATSEAAERAIVRAGLDLETFNECIKYVLDRRIWQVSSVKGRSEDRSLEYPLCLYPLLETFGRVEDYEGGLEIWPEQPGSKPVEPEKYYDFIRVLRTHRIPVAKGLPLVVRATNDMFYRLSIREGNILAACDGQNIDPATVLTRCFYDMPLMMEFGLPRYTLGPVAAQRSAISLLVRLGLTE